MARHYMTKRSCYCGDETTAIDQVIRKGQEILFMHDLTECCLFVEHSSNI